MKPVFALLALFTLASCQEISTDTEEEGKKLMQISRDWSRIAQTDSIDKILDYWDSTAVVMSPGQPAMKGHQAIRAMHEGTSKIPGFKISWEPLSVVVSDGGEMAYMIEQNQVTMNDSTGKPVTEYNKSVTIWKKDKDGNWKNVVDIWNADPTRQK
jgi:ketosteroid isomerase-like protein